MAFNLEKKKPFSISMAKPKARKIMIGLGWDPATINGQVVDPDASIFMLDANGKLQREEDLVFFNNLNPYPYIKHGGDERVGADDGDDETIEVDLSQVDSRIETLVVSVTIHESGELGHHFGHVENAFARIVDLSDNTVLCQYDLTENYDGNDSIIVATINRDGGKWNVEAQGRAFAGGLQALIDLYY